MIGPCFCPSISSSIQFIAIKSFFFFFFNDTATTEIYTLSLHDALPIRPYVGAHREIFLDAQVWKDAATLGTVRDAGSQNGRRHLGLDLAAVEHDAPV